MPFVIKLKTANATTRLVPFDARPSWKDLASKIGNLYSISSNNVGVVFIDEAKDVINLTNEQELQSFYEVFNPSSGKIKFVVQDLQNLDPTIASTWSADSNLSDLSKADDQLILFCWVLNVSDNPFPVNIEKGMTAGQLKDEIKKKKEHTFDGIEPDTLELWKLSPPISSAEIDTKLRDVQSPQQIPGCDKLNAMDELLGHFSSTPSNHLHVIVEVPPTPKRKQAYEATKDGRKWAVNGAIRDTDIHGCYYVDPGTQDESTRCFNALVKRQFVLLAGARASGKTTRLFWLKGELEEAGYHVIYLSFESVDFDNVQTFWNSFGHAVQKAAFSSPLAVSQNFTPILSVQDFLSFFYVKAWKRNVILVIDEFSDLYYADIKVRDQCLRAFRDIRNNPDPYAIRGMIAAGTFSILYLTPTFKTSPFNVADHVINPYFSLDETRNLFLEFARDNFITIEDAVIEDVWVKSNGHPGMICLCGRAIYENLPHLLDFSNVVLSYKSWRTFSSIHLHERAYEYITFRSMIESLLREEATPAVNFLRSRFVGFLETVSLPDAEQRQHADSLTAEGVLLKSGPHHYRIASAFVDGFIQRYLIPTKFPNAPSTAPPMASDGRPRVLEILTQSLKFFDKDLIRLAAVRSFKQSKVNVGGLRAAHVPRESVYDTELMRILTNWLTKQAAYEINGQWHLQTDQKNKYCNIVISKPTTPTVVLELLATGDVSFVRAHIEKTPYYKDLLSADEAWVIHFTCEDHYLDHPTWQSDDQLQREGINVVHIWHDQGFSTVSMSARWKDADGNIFEVTKQPVAL